MAIGVRGAVGGWLHKVEMVLWLMRPNFFCLALGPMAAWLAAGATDGGRFAAFSLAIALASGVILLSNDVFDYKKDRAAGSYRPIASGRISRQGAIGAGALIVVACLALVIFAVRFPLLVVASLAIMVFTLAAAFVYSAVKKFGFVAPVVVGGTHAAEVALIFLLARAVEGGVGPSLVPVVVVAAMVFVSSFAGNVGSTIVDVENDTMVGNRTVAVRIGQKPAFAVMAVTHMAGVLPPLALAVILNRLLLLPVGIVIVAMTAAETLKTSRRISEGNLSRLTGGYLSAMGDWAIRAHLLVLVILSPRLGGVAAVLVIAGMWLNSQWYERRIQPLKAEIRRPAC